MMSVMKILIRPNRSLSMPSAATKKKILRILNSANQIQTHVRRCHVEKCGVKKSSAAAFLSLFQTLQRRYTMRAFIIFTIALLGFALADEVPTEENVYVLNKDNFDQVLSSTQYVLVEFCKYPIIFLTIITSSQCFKLM